MLSHLGFHGETTHQRTSGARSHITGGIIMPLSFVLGVCGLQVMPALPPPATALCVPALAAVAYFSRYGKTPLLLLCLFAVGFFYAAARADWRLSATLPPALIWQDISVEGTVIGAPRQTAERTQFELAIETLAAPQSRPTQVIARISDYHRDQPPLAAIKEGARLRTEVRLRPPPAAFNPHGFDYAGYLFARGTHLQGYVRQRETLTAIAPADPPSIRQILRQRIFASDAPRTGLLAALIVGDRQALSDDDWRVLRRTGTAHLVSVSGTHIGLIFALVAAFVSFVWRRTAALRHLLPAAQAALLAALPAAFAYACLAGLGIPVQRSFLMVATAAAALLLSGGAMAASTTLALTMLVVVVFDPWAVTTAGFWLSFLLAGTVILVVFTRSHRPLLLWRLLRAQLLVSLIAVPLTLWFFNEASLLSPLANFIAVPVIGFLVLPLALLGCFIGDWTIAGHMLEWLWRFLEVLADLPFAAWSPAQAPPALFALALGGGIWLLMPRGVPHRIAGMLPIIAMLLWQAPAPPVGGLRMTVLDIGQGNAVILQTASHTAVYDTGREFGGRITADFLRGEGVRRLDTLILSHDDGDHRGGSDFLRTAYPPQTLIAGAADGDEVCHRGQYWTWDNVSFEVLHPRPPVTVTVRTNNDSCVLRITTAGGRSLLLTGDISAATELALRPPPTDVLLVSHHGSRSSTETAFLQRLAPSVAIISAGKDNHYGHPHPQTLERLTAANAEIYRTDTDGAVVVLLTDTIDIFSLRQKQLRYWHRQNSKTVI